MDDLDLHRFTPGYGKRPEFAALERDEGRRLNARENDLLSGAMNLLDKALTRRSDGDDARADRLIALSAAMPYDPRMEGSPGIRGADQLLHDLITDWFEDSEVDDLRWLEVATAAHEQLAGPGRDGLASIVHGIVLQAGIYETSRNEQRQIRRAFGHAPLEADLGDAPGLTPEAREPIIRSLLTAVEVLEAEAQRTG